MATTYKYDHAPSRHVIKHALAVLAISAVVLAAIGGGFAWDAYHHHHVVTVNGSVTQVPQSTTPQTYLQVSEPFFTMQLPSDWKQTGSQNTASVHSISWQATAKDADNRYLTIYIDTIPSDMPVNRELPLSVHGNELIYGALSDNCSSFTAGGTTNVARAETLKPTSSVWQGVNFICNLPEVIDNQVGTGSTAGVNTVTVTGPTSGTHSYFFLYTDHNIDPDYTTLYDAIQSFRAK